LGLGNGLSVMLKFVEDYYFEQLVKSSKYEAGILPESVHLIENYQLTKVGCNKILMDIYYRDKKPVDDRAAVVFLHGGGFWGGDKKQFQMQAAYLALRYNIFAVSLNYRLNHEGLFPAALQDVKCAIRWLRSVKFQYNIHPSQIILVGGSPGGNLAALAACTPGIQEFEGNSGFSQYASDVNVAVALNGIFDFFDFLKSAPSERENVKRYLGGYAEEIPEIYKKASPLVQVTKITAPMLLLHGRNDEVIPWQKSLQMYRKLKKCGVQSEIKIFEGKGHGWFNQMPDSFEIIGPIERFLDQYHFL
jgi:acetyl esterase/lipase